jgi:hypothetical protein
MIVNNRQGAYLVSMFRGGFDTWSYFSVCVSRPAENWVVTVATITGDSARDDWIAAKITGALQAWLHANDWGQGLFAPQVRSAVPDILIWAGEADNADVVAEFTIETFEDHDPLGTSAGPLATDSSK